MANEGAFKLAIGEFVEKTESRASLAVRRIALGLLRAIVMKTPVGNPSLWKNPPPPGYVGGRLRGNWRVSVDQPASGDLTRVDPGGNATISEGEQVLSGYEAGPTIFIVNNLPYAIPVEYGHSSQAPQGMLRLSVAEYQKHVDEAVKSL